MEVIQCMQQSAVYMAGKLTKQGFVYFIHLWVELSLHYRISFQNHSITQNTIVLV